MRVRSHQGRTRWRLAVALVWGLVSVSLAANTASAAPRGATMGAATTAATTRQDLDLDAARAAVGCALARIDHVGLRRTDERVVRRELTLRVGQLLGHAALRESVRRLRNLGIFRRVDVAVRVDGGRCTLTLAYDEKWTLLPVFSLGRGGGITFLTLGAQDNHVAGRLWEVAALWQLFGGVHSGGLTLADPRVADARVRVGVSASLLRRNRQRFDADGTALAGWSRHRWQLGLSLADVRRPELPLRASLWWLDDRFDAALLDPTERSEARALGLPARRRWLAVGLGVTAGRVDLDDYLERGATLDVDLLGGFGVAGPGGADAQASWLRGVVEARVAALPWRRLNLVARVRAGAVSRPVEEVGLYVGGLDGVRGLADSRYFGAVALVANAEARLPSWVSTWLVVQHVAFVDVGHAAADVGALFRPVVPWSLGSGVRFIVPRLARLVARVDLAYAFEQRDGWLLSFGGQQAF